MTKIALNDCYGGFSLSQKAYERLIELGIKTRRKEDLTKSELEILVLDEQEISIYGKYYVYWDDDMRTNPLLIQTIEELGSGANGECADIRIAEIPDSIEYYIDDYDGIETVHQVHDSW